MPTPNHNPAGTTADSTAALDSFGPGRGSRRRHGGRNRPAGRGPGGPGPGGRKRARRGAVAQGALLVLGDEAPLHGYDIITKLEERSEGRWRPSPGSMYPSLARLEDRGLIQGIEGDDGKKLYELTETGRERIAKRDPDAPLPWDQESAGPSTSLRPLIAEIVSQGRQLGRFGTTAQRDEAVKILTETKSKLYAVLANPEPATSSDEVSSADH